MIVSDYAAQGMPMNTEKLNPFTHDYEQVPLPNSPLVSVIAQVRFPTIISIQKPEFIAPFQEALRSEYSTLQSDRRIAINIGPSLNQFEETIWRFSDSPEWRWRVTLAPEFLAIECKQYTSRADFLSKLRVLLDKFAKHFNPGRCDRLGVRYVDRIVKDVDKISEMVRGDALGFLNTEIRSFSLNSLSHSIFKIDQSSMLSAKWGFLGENQTYDQSSLPPIKETSWVLD